MKEIINESMSQANDEYIKEILERMDHMNIFSKSLKDEVINLTSLNQKMS
jgi:chromosome segregation ATPase